MRAIVCERFGAPDVLRLRDDFPMVEPGPGQIRVKVHAASVNYPDGLIVANKYQTPVAPPFIPGQEGAGVVDKIGPGVSGFAVGDRVAGFGGSGAFAEYMVLDVAKAVLVPASVSFEAAAASCLTYGTTIHALRTRGHLQPGETLLVLGAGGGVGSAAVEMGKLMGATVIAAASSDDKLDVARACGADHLINYGRDDLRAGIRGICGDKGVDVIYDPVCGPLAEPAFRSIGWNGRFLVIGFAGGIAPLPLNLPLLKGAAVIGVFWGASVEREPGQFRKDINDVFGWLAEGKLSPPIGARYPLERTPQAIADMLAGGAMGKLVIDIGG